MWKTNMSQEFLVGNLLDHLKNHKNNLNNKSQNKICAEKNS